MLMKMPSTISPPEEEEQNVLEEGSLGSKSAEGATATPKNDNDDTLTEEERWTNCYGALILFFEEFGHTFVPSDHNNPPYLYQWVEAQRTKLSELSAQQVKQLLIFNFKFAGQPWNPARPWHCKVAGCIKFAAFNGFCHGHFMKPPPKPTPTPKVDSVPVKKKTNKSQQKRINIEFPLVGLRQTRKNGNYDIENTKEKAKDITRDEVIDKLVDFVEKLSQVNCSGSQWSTSCTCLKFVSDKPYIIKSMAHALMDYFDLNHVQRKHYSVERLRYADMAKAEGRKRRNEPQLIFSLPLSYDYFETHDLPGTTAEEDEGEESEGDSNEKQQIIAKAFKHQICTLAFRKLHNVGALASQRLNKYLSGDVSVGQNRNKGRKWPGGVRFAEAYESMRDSLNVLMEEHREDQQLGPDDDVILPLQISRRKCYEQWCHDRGWDVKKKNADTGQYAGSGAWDVAPGFFRTLEDALANGGEARNVAKLPVSWTLYSKFWREEFPQLKTQGRVGKGMFGGAYDFERKKYYNRKQRTRASSGLYDSE